MGINTKKVRLRLVAAAVLLVVPLCTASLCPPGLQYWSNEYESCINCSRCDASAKQVVLRPCQAHADTVCGPISDLDIDWSWLKHKHAGKHHEKHLDDIDTLSEKKHHGKGHKHHNILDDDVIERAPSHHSELDDDVEMLPPVTHHGNHKHHKHSKVLDDDSDFEKKHSRNHHVSPESFLSEDLEPIVGHKKMFKLPPPPPLKSTDDLEKEWKEWLIQSKNRLQHRKDDLLKTLHKENNEKHHFSHRLNRPSDSSHSTFDDFDGEIFHHSAHHKDHSQKKHFSPLDLEIFDRLLSHDNEEQKERLRLSHLLNPENNHASPLDMMKSEDKREEKTRPFAGNDLGYPMDSFDFRSVVPTHRLFLGEPSTVSEIRDQDMLEESEDDEDERLKEDKDTWGDPSVVAVPFTATERFVWDWQAVALTSAVAACLLFFAVVAGYSILHARQWRRLKTNFDSDAEEMSVKVGLMQSQCVASSAADGVNTNHYLENLLENQKKKSGNIYTQKRPQS